MENKYSFNLNFTRFGAWEYMGSIELDLWTNPHQICRNDDFLWPKHDVAMLYFISELQFLHRASSTALSKLKNDEFKIDANKFKLRDFRD